MRSGTSTQGCVIARCTRDALPWALLPLSLRDALPRDLFCEIRNPGLRHRSLHSRCLALGFVTAVPSGRLHSDPSRWICSVKSATQGCVTARCTRDALPWALLPLSLRDDLGMTRPFAPSARRPPFSWCEHVSECTCECSDSRAAQTRGMDGSQGGVIPDDLRPEPARGRVHAGSQGPRSRLAPINLGGKRVGLWTI